jgi:DNA-binding beta-propeller fold protein YncE
VWASGFHFNSSPFAQPGFRSRDVRFERLLNFKVNGRVAEIMAATPNGRMLLYTNADDKKIGVVDISNPAQPREYITINVDGEPTSIAVTPDGRWALAAVAAGNSHLAVISLPDGNINTIIPLGGQPDSIAISPNGRYAAIAIENERDESLNSGRMPQAPAGFLTIVDLVGSPMRWRTRDVSLLGLRMRFPEDPEPEYVTINRFNEVAVTLQENNHIVIVDLPTGRIKSDFPAGTSTHAADIRRNNDIALTDMLIDAPREPDAIVWTPRGNLLTANEGDYTVDLATGRFAGGRDFTIFAANGNLVYESGADVELEAIKHGHYPDARSAAKGIELEGAAVGIYNGQSLAFIGSERGNFVAVYNINNEHQPRFVQLLPTGISPEGLLAIPQRGLFVTANEVDGTISIFATTRGLPPSYPFIVSNGISWSALSGLSEGPGRTFYAVPDSAFAPSRIFTMSLGNPILGIPTRVTNVLTLPGNYDLEGIATRPGGGWWVVSEGAGVAGATTATKNLLLQINGDGALARTVELPAAVNAQQVQFGFEGVTTNSDGSQVYVAFQREWRDDPARLVKIGRFTPATGEWRFFHYPIEAAAAGAWVGLSEITRIDDTTFAILERDNQLGTAARIKRLYTVSIAGVTPAVVGEKPPVLTKTLLRDLWYEDGFILEKAEGVLRLANGSFIVINDNDGVGETRVFRISRED